MLNEQLPAEVLADIVGRLDVPDVVRLVSAGACTDSALVEWATFSRGGARGDAAAWLPRLDRVLFSWLDASLHPLVPSPEKVIMATAARVVRAVQARALAGAAVRSVRFDSLQQQQQAGTSGIVRALNFASAPAPASAPASASASAPADSGEAETLVGALADMAAACCDAAQAEEADVQQEQQQEQQPGTGWGRQLCEEVAKAAIRLGMPRAVDRLLQSAASAELLFGRHQVEVYRHPFRRCVLGCDHLSGVFAAAAAGDGALDIRSAEAAKRFIVGGLSFMFGNPALRSDAAAVVVRQLVEGERCPVLVRTALGAVAASSSGGTNMRQLLSDPENPYAAVRSVRSAAALMEVVSAGGDPAVVCNTYRYNALGAVLQMATVRTVRDAAECVQLLLLLMPSTDADAHVSASQLGALDVVCKKYIQRGEKDGEALRGLLEALLLRGGARADGRDRHGMPPLAHLCRRIAELGAGCDEEDEWEARSLLTCVRTLVTLGGAGVDCCLRPLPRNGGQAVIHMLLIAALLPLPHPQTAACGLRESAAYQTFAFVLQQQQQQEPGTLWESLNALIDVGSGRKTTLLHIVAEAAARPYGEDDETSILEVIGLLRSHGADAAVADGQGDTPYSLAMIALLQEQKDAERLLRALDPRRRC